MSASEVEQRLQQLLERVRVGAGEGLFLTAEHVLQVSRTRVPIEEGTLERSGATSVDTEKLEAVIAYDTPYAVAQHEHMDYVHDNGRQAKFLESALTGERDVIRQLLATSLRAALKQ